MIKKFDGEWGSINFVDENNVLIGYDMSAQCCEDFGYKEECIIEKSEFTGEFDEDFKGVDHEGYNFDCGVAFFTRDTETKRPNGQIVFFNSHNGYYSHGYKMLKNNEVITDGFL